MEKGIGGQISDMKLVDNCEYGERSFICEDL
jgi:hypothetical protein